MSTVFVDQSGSPKSAMKGWSPLIIKRSEIEAEIERLADLSSPESGLRAARLVHPMSRPPGLGMTPGMDITLHVLKPGESSAPVRHNSSQVSVCIRGQGSAMIGRREFGLSRHDVWTTPAMRPYIYRNLGEDLLVRLSYSNAALLEKLCVHYVELMPPDWLGGPSATHDSPTASAALKPLPPPVAVGSDGAQLLTYDHLISPEAIDNQPLHWPWSWIEAERDRVFASPDALKDKGRRGLFVLFNPATGRTKGATHSFFATVGFMPTNVIDFPHRHSSSAVNYALAGSFISEVDGERFRWEAGDIAYTAPGWSAHANGSETSGIALTVQDHPFQIATESLVWQEGEGKPIRLLGAEQGFASDDSVRLRTAK